MQMRPNASCFYLTIEPLQLKLALQRGTADDAGPYENRRAATASWTVSKCCMICHESSHTDNDIPEDARISRVCPNV